MKLGKLFNIDMSSSTNVTACHSPQRRWGPIMNARTVLINFVVFFLGASGVAHALEEAKLLSMDGVAGDEFGRSVDLDGDTAIVGAHRDGDLGNEAGAAFIFVRNGLNWDQQAKLLPGDGFPGDRFGVSVAVDGSTAVVGSAFDDGSGAVYVFTRSGTNWVQDAKITVFFGVVFGFSVDVDGDRIVVGDPLDSSDSMVRQGAAYVFRRRAGGWVQEAKLIAGNAAQDDRFGRRVSISGDRVIVGAPLNDENGSGSGAAYIFFRESGSEWVEEEPLLPDDPLVNANFGTSVAIDGNRAIVGAYRDDALGTNSGSAYIFSRSVEGQGSNDWGDPFKVVASDGAPFDQFGTSVSFSGEFALVGAPLADSGQLSDVGAAYVYRFVEGSDEGEMEPSFLFHGKLTACNGSGADSFGEAVSIDGERALAGARYDDEKGASAGAAYVFGIDVTSPIITCPSDLVSECTSTEGAVVTFSVTATDNQDPSPTIVSDPPSGSTFPVGDTIVSSTATDISGNFSTCSFLVTVADVTAPSLTCPSNMSVECSGPDGAMVNFPSFTVTDDCDPDVVVSATPLSGSVFPLGDTSVTVTATDASGNSDECMFTVTVADTTGPDVVCPQDISVECTGTSGEEVSFTVTATDVCDLNPSVTADPASGTVFTFGETTVTGMSMDASGNTSSCTFTVTVQDTVAPQIQCPNDIIVQSEGPGGANVSFTVTASDICDTAPSVVSSPPSGSLFPVGSTTVVNTATDASGNQVMCTFEVIVEALVAPLDGSMDGGNQVNVFGTGFNDPSVLFGVNMATVVSFTSNRIVVRTPPGTGTVDVTVINMDSSMLVLSSAYTYVDPVIAARFGNVNVGLGNREDVLLLNGLAGDAERIVQVDPGSPFSLRMELPSSRVTSRYAMWAWRGLSDPNTLTEGPSDLGMFCMEPPFVVSPINPPRKIWNLLFHTSQLGVPDFPSDPAPYTFFSRPGRAMPITVTFQGLIRDDGARVPEGFSITNAVVLQIE